MFAGTLTGTFFNVAGFALQDDINLALGRYFGFLSADGHSIAGSFTLLGGEVIAGSWTVHRVPEPGVVGLLGLALALLVAQRRRLN